jgi:hypothetical protein
MSSVALLAGSEHGDKKGREAGLLDMYFARPTCGHGGCVAENNQYATAFNEAYVDSYNKAYMAIAQRVHYMDMWRVHVQIGSFVKATLWQKVNRTGTHAC